MPNLFALSPIAETALAATDASSKAQPPPPSLAALASRSSKNKPKNILSTASIPPSLPPSLPPSQSVIAEEDKPEVAGD
jgi:hypothetical protein